MKLNFIQKGEECRQFFSLVLEVDMTRPSEFLGYINIFTKQTFIKIKKN